MSLKRVERSATFEEIMSPHVVFCSPDDSIPQIAKIMRDQWIDSVFVKDSDGKTIGVITDGIIWDIVAREKDPRDYKAKDIMYKPFLSVKANEPIYSIEALRDLIDKSKVKRIAVKKDDKIVGVVRKKIIDRFKRVSRHFKVEFR